MKNLLIVFLFTPIIIFSDNSHLFHIETRLRVVNEKTLYVIVQIDNKSGRRISQLSGFLTESDINGKIISEKKIVHINSKDPILINNQTSSRGLTFPFNKKLDHKFKYNINKIVFQNDFREFIWTKKEGLIRIN